VPGPTAGRRRLRRAGLASGRVEAAAAVGSAGVASRGAKVLVASAATAVAGPGRRLLRPHRKHWIRLGIFPRRSPARQTSGALFRKGTGGAVDGIAGYSRGQPGVRRGLPRSPQGVRREAGRVRRWALLGRDSAGRQCHQDDRCGPTRTRGVRGAARQRACPCGGRRPFLSRGTRAGQ